MPISLIINADDFGITKGVNESIQQCHIAGSVTSASIMTNMEAAYHAAQLALEHPTLGVGLHFNLTQGQPLSARESVPSLVDSNGDFLSRGSLIGRGILGLIRAEEVELELRTQIDRMRDLGLSPSHFDSHQHVHTIPSIFNVLSAMAISMNLPVRIPWRWRGKPQEKSLSRVVRESVLNTMINLCAPHEKQNLKTNDGFCSTFDLQVAPEELSEASYLQLLQPYDSGIVELMVHVAIVDKELEKKTDITAVSKAENRLMRSSFIRQYVQSNGGSLITYRDIR